MKNPLHFVSIMQNNTTDFDIKNQLPLRRRHISTEIDLETLCKAFEVHWIDQLQVTAIDSLNITKNYLTSTSTSEFVSIQMKEISTLYVRCEVHTAVTMKTIVFW